MILSSSSRLCSHWHQMQQGVQVSRDCALCPRLLVLRQQLRQQHPDWYNAPINGFGDDITTASLLIVGLAPGMKGANRTGRPFTGDGAGDILYDTLLQFGFASGHYARGVADDLLLRHCRIVNAVRCLPPQNKPTPAEIRQCQGFLQQEIACMPRLKVVIALGLVAHQAVLGLWQLRKVDYPFAHGARHELPAGDKQTQTIRLIDSYHCSRYNTQTRRLTPAMFAAVFAEAKKLMGL